MTKKGGVARAREGGMRELGMRGLLHGKIRAWRTSLLS